MKERIKAICLEKPNNVVVKEVPYPEKSDNDVLIQVLILVHIEELIH